MKNTSNANGYGVRRLPASGPKLKIKAMTMAYSIGSIPDFSWENFRGALKTHLKISDSKSVYSLRRPFCWYRKDKRSRRISLFPSKGIEQMAPQERWRERH